jgi:hypothetical protein
MTSDKSREMRFGLVMYGGVSLAIYINGVTHEFSRLVRGNGVYKLIKGLTDTEMVVDIISGTSAGGINGIFLAYALANDKDFGSMAQLWRDLGDIEKLLRPINANPENCQSLLRSEDYYEPQLHDAIAKMPDYCRPEDDPAPKGEIDLFVTGTNVEGEVYTVIDDEGHLIDVKDHRSVFWLKHRPNRENVKLPFAPNENTYQSLARIARITSCFPAAFAPVLVQAAGASDDTPLDATLRGWGNLFKEAYFLDGGVLNNKPFTHTIRAIFRHQARRPVVRHLCYVEPDPEYFPDKPVRLPSFFSAAFEGSIGIKSYESIADDLKRISDHNSQVDRYRQVCRELRGAFPRWPQESWDRPGPYNFVVLPSESVLFEARSRDEGNAVLEQESAAKSRGEPAAGVPSFFSIAVRELFTRSRFTGLGSRALKGLFKDDSTGQPVALKPELRDRATQLVAELINLKPEGNVLSDEESLFRFDVYFRLRRLYHVVYLIAKQLGEVDDADIICTLRALWQALNDHVQIVEIIRYWMEYVMDHSQIAWENEPSAREIWGDIRWCLEELLVMAPIQDQVRVLPAPILPTIEIRDEKVAETDTERELRREEEKQKQVQFKAFYECLRMRAEMICKRPKTAAKRPFRETFSGLLNMTDIAARHVFDDKDGRTAGIREEFVQYVALDALVYPLEFVSGLDARDRIQILRMSPCDAQSGFSAREIQEKVAGRALAHFGGFFKRAWRSNDILWGRLDAVCELVENTLTESRLRDIVEKESLRTKLLNRFVDPSYTVAQFFPHTLDKTGSKVDQWISDLLNNSKEVRDAAIKLTKEMAILLIEMAQLEILFEGIPAVIADAAEEQAQWNQYAVPLKESGILSAKQIVKLARAQTYSSNATPQEKYETLAGNLAGWTRQNAESISAVWKECFPGKTDIDWWNHPSDTYGLTNGEKLVDEAIRASRKALAAKVKSPDAFQPTRGFVEPFVASLAADQYARASIADLTETPPAAGPLQSKMGAFFRQKYNVGSEDIWTGIPWLVLLEVLAHTGLVLRNCVLGALPKPLREKIGRHPLFRFGFDFPLRFVYWTVQFSRQASATFLISQAIVATFAIAMIFVAVIRWDSLLYVSGHLMLKNVWYFVLLPILALYLVAKLIDYIGRNARVLKGVFLAVAVAAGFGSLFYWLASINSR